MAEVKRRFLRLNQCIPLEGFLTGWFLGAPAESICRGNVEDFVAYGFYSRYMHELPPHVRPWAPSILPSLVLRSMGPVSGQDGAHLCAELSPELCRCGGLLRQLISAFAVCGILLCGGAL